MSKTVYRDYLKGRLISLDSAMNAAESRLASGSPQQKLDAASELAYIERHLSETRAKLARLEAEPDGLWENVKTALEQNFDQIETALDRWIERQDYAFAHAPDDAEDGKSTA